MMVFGIVHFLGFAGRDWSCAVEFSNYVGHTGALTTIGHLVIFLILLKTWWKEVSGCVRMTPVKSFHNHTNHSIVMIKYLNALYMSISG